VPPIETLRRWRDGVADGTLKLYLTSRLLRLRRDDGAGLTSGEYAPLRAGGVQGERLVAYRRGTGAATRIVFASRLTAGLGEGAPIGALWGDARVETGASATEWRCQLSGVRVSAVGGAIEVARALAELPVAVLAPTNAG
jgi:(1->4)-alpha-D-glucan 1-alpha-D-glucosylmutase